MNDSMNYSEMFDRNIGVLTQDEQIKIRNKKVAIIGCGGMGGISAQIIARTGIGGVAVADPDKFEVVNINNQYTAFKSTIGKNKATVLGDFLRDINPEMDVVTFEEGLNESNVKEIIDSSDIIFDCVDFNELYYSYILNEAARKSKKYVLAPQAIGYGCSVLVFDPNGMTLNDYLGLRDGMSREEVNSVIIPPEKWAPIELPYIENEIIEKVVTKKIPIPNIALAQTLAASMMSAEAIFILLGKRKPVVVPEIIAIDLLEKKLQM